MKQLVIIEIENCDDKQRSKAMKILAGLQGIESVALQRENRNRIAVVGNGVDSVNLTNLLRKKMKQVKLVSVTPVNDGYLSDDEAQHLTYHRRPSNQAIVPYNVHGYKTNYLDYPHHVPSYYDYNG